MEGGIFIEQAKQEFNLQTYNPFEKTAIKRGRRDKPKLSKPMQILYDKGLLVGEVIDFGCGHGQDIGLLKEKGLHIEGYDKFNITYKKEELLNKKYQAVVCNYVFNVAPFCEIHNILKQLCDLVDEKGNIYICVRADSKAIKKTWIYDANIDAWITTNGSLQRFYDDEKVKSHFGEVEYISNTSSYKLLKLKQ